MLSQMQDSEEICLVQRVNGVSILLLFASVKAYLRNGYLNYQVQTFS